MGQTRQPDRRDDGRAASAQDPLVVGGVRCEERIRDRQIDDRIAEELEPFVVAGRVVRVFVQPARMDERLGDEVRVADGETQPFRERGGGSHGERGGAR